MNSLKDVFIEWMPVIGLFGPVLCAWIWWSVHQRFTPRTAHAELKDRVSALEKTVQDLPDKSALNALCLEVQEVRGEVKVTNTRLDGISDGIKALNNNMDMLIQHHITTSGSE